MNDTIQTAHARPFSVDAHAHIVPDFIGGDPEQVWRCQGALLRRGDEGELQIETARGFEPKRYAFDAESVDARLDYMNGAMVDMQVLSLMPAMWTYGLSDHDTRVTAARCNDWMIEVAERHPDRFRIFAHLPLDHPDLAVRELQRVMESPVVVGAAVGTNVCGRNWDDPELFSVLQCAEQLGAVLFYHPSAVRLKPSLPRHQLLNFIGNPSDTTIAIADLLFGGVLDRLPKLRAIFSHGGGYACFAAPRWDHGFTVRADARLNADRLPSEQLKLLYFDNILWSDDALRFVIEQVGTSQVVLGTDFPANMGPAEPVRDVLASPALTTDEKRAILGENLARLLGLDASRRPAG